MLPIGLSKSATDRQASSACIGAARAENGTVAKMRLQRFVASFLRTFHDT